MGIHCMLVEDQKNIESNNNDDSRDMFFEFPPEK